MLFRDAAFIRKITLNKLNMKNWRTSLIGFLAAFWLVAQPIITNGDFDIERDWKSLIGAAIATAFGLLTKDKNVTGVGEDAKTKSETQSIIGGSTPPPTKDEK